MNMTLQSHPPNARAKVSSSVIDGWALLPGCVCSQIRPQRAGGMLISALFSM